MSLYTVLAYFLPPTLSAETTVRGWSPATNKRSGRRTGKAICRQQLQTHKKEIDQGTFKEGDFHDPSLLSFYMPDEYHLELVVSLSCGVQYALVASLMTGLYPAVLDTLRMELNVPHVDMAFLVSMYDLFQIIGAVCWSLSVAMRLTSTGRLVAAGGLLSCAGALMFAIAGTYVHLVASQVMLGIGAAAINVLCPSLLLQSTVGRSTSRCSLLLSLVYAASSGGVVAAYLVVGSVGPDPWRLLFAINGIVFVIPAAILAVVTPGKQQHTPSRRTRQPQSVELVRPDVDKSHEATGAISTTSSREDLDEAAPVSDSARLTQCSSDGDRANDPETQSLSRATVSAFTSMVLHLLSDRIVMLIVAVQVFVSFGVSGFIAFIPTFIKFELGESATKASRTVGLAIPACTVGMIACGVVAERWKLGTRGLLLMIVFLTAALVPLNAAFLVQSYRVFTIMLVAYMAVPFSVAVPSTMALAQVLRSSSFAADKDADSLVAHVNAFATVAVKLLGAFTGPLVLGLLLDHPEIVPSRMAYFLCGLVSSALAVLCAGATLLLSENKSDAAAQLQSAAAD